MSGQTITTLNPRNRSAWRSWLQKNHDKHQSVWVVYYKKSASNTTITYEEAVEEALCFGWIDSKAKPVDGERFMQFFSRRKPNGTWSKINKARIKRLISEGKMTQAGLDVIDKAKSNGSWTILDEVEELIIPKDLESAFRKRKNAKKYFLSLSKSRKRYFLQWLVLAKRPETRAQRIMEIVALEATA